MDIGTGRAQLLAALVTGASWLLVANLCGAQEAPVLTALYLPETVDVSNGPAELVVEYSMTDDFSGATQISIILMPPGQPCGPTLSDSFAPVAVRNGTLRWTLGQFTTPIGVWTICSVYVADGVGSQRTYSTAELQDLAFATSFTVTGTQDVSAPVLSELVLPTSVDVSVGPAQVVVDYAATDDASGFRFAYLGLLPPGGSCGGYASATHNPSLVVSGSLSFQLGRFNSPIGRWLVCDLYVVDLVGNHRRYDAAELEVLGFPSGFDVIGVQDTTPPQLLSFHLPAVADVTSGSVVMPITYSVADDLSGAGYFGVNLAPPGLGCVTSVSEGFAAVPARSADLGLHLGRFSTPIGVWSVCSVTLTDAVGNPRVYTAADLDELGWPTSFTTVGAQDLAAPELAALEVPAVVDVSSGPATLMIDYTVVDDASGASYVSVQLQPAGAFCGPTPQEGFESTKSRSGTLLHQLGRYDTPIGTWTICTVVVADTVGNHRFYSTDELQQLGMPTTFAVTGTQDVTAPQLTALVLPELVDISDGPRDLTVQYSLADDLSGATYVSVAFQPPGQGCHTSAQESFAASLARDGTLTLALNQFKTAVGPWPLCAVSVVDAVGNSRTYSGAEIGALGFPSALTVVGTQDVTAPVLTSLSITPATLHLGDSPHRLRVEYGVSDDLSGARFFGIRWTHPVYGCGYPAISDHFVPELERAHVGEVIVGRSTLQEGTHTVCGLDVCDAADNCRSYDAAAIAAEGWMPALHVLPGSEPDPPPPAVDVGGSYEGSWRDSMGFSGSAFAIVVQDGASISGEARVSGADCLSATSLSGRVQADTLLATIANETNQIDFRLARTGAGLEGVFEIAAGCYQGTTGTVLLTLLPTPTPTATTTATASRTSTRTITATRTATATRSSTPTASPSPPPTPSPSVTVTGTITATRSSTPTATATPTATPTLAPCASDCNGDGDVTVDELVRAVGIAPLGAHHPSICPAADWNQNGELVVEELLDAVERALQGCT